MSFLLWMPLKMDLYFSLILNITRTYHIIITVFVNHICTELYIRICHAKPWCLLGWSFHLHLCIRPAGKQLCELLWKQRNAMRKFWSEWAEFIVSLDTQQVPHFGHWNMTDMSLETYSTNLIRPLYNFCWTISHELTVMCSLTNCVLQCLTTIS